MAEDNASETPAVAPKPRAPRKRTPTTPAVPAPVENDVEAVVKPAPKPRKPRKTAAQKAQEAAEADRLKAEADKKVGPEVSSPVNDPAEAPAVKEPEVAAVVAEEPSVPEERVLDEKDIPEKDDASNSESAKEEAHGGVEQLQALFAEADKEPEPEPVVPPLSVRGVILAPGYWQGFEGPHGRLNVFSFLGVIFAFTFFPLGFIFSLLGLMNAKAVVSDKIGRALGWIGLVVSGIAAFITVLWLLFLPLSLAFGGPVGHHLY